MRLFIAFAALLVLASPPAHAQDDDAEAPKVEAPTPTESFIAGIYKTYIAGEPEPAREADVYSKRLEALFDQDAAETPDGEAGRLDFDPFVDGQDWEIGGLKVKELYRSGGEARVRADFANFGEPRSILFDLVREDGTWRIDDIAETLQPRWTLSKILTGAADAFPDAEADTPED